MLILDEPFNGMDPEGIIWMRGFLRCLAAQGCAILVSSHLMSKLQDTAGAELCSSKPGVLLIKGMSSERAVVLLTRHAIAFTEVSAHRATLEEAYLALAGDAVEFRAVTR